MVIWIDGVLGSGKTTVAKRLCEDMKCLEIIEADLEWIKYRKKKTNPFHGGTMPQTDKEFLVLMRDMILKKMQDRTLIIVMAIVREECKSILYDRIREMKDFYHIILNVSEPVLKDRISKQEGRDISFAISEYKEDLRYLKLSFPRAVWIDVDNKSIEDVSNEVLAKTGLGSTCCHGGK